MDWFEQLTGFKEEDYASTQSRLAVDGRRLRSLANGKSAAVGEFELVTLECLRERAALADGPSGSVNVKLVTGDVRELHRRPEYSGGTVSSCISIQHAGDGFSHRDTRTRSDPISK